MGWKEDGGNRRKRQNRQEEAVLLAAFDFCSTRASSNPSLAHLSTDKSSHSSHHSLSIALQTVSDFFEKTYKFSYNYFIYRQLKHLPGR